MDDEYDVVVLGTGIKECILSGLFSVSGKKVLHMDRNPYYGGECASLNLAQMFEAHGNGETAPESLGRSRDFNIDLVPKFLMASGKLVEILLHTRVSRYLEFKVIDGSFVNVSGKVSKVPVTAGDALKSDLMGFFQKRKAKNFLEFVGNLDEDNKKTWKGRDLRKMTMQQLYNDFGLDTNSADFVGHALALHHRDDYKNQPALATVKKIALYAESLARYKKSPYIYPLYGLGELPQAFARLAAIHGGTFMLDKQFDGVTFDEEMKVSGVRSGDEVAKCKVVIADPTYFRDKCEKASEILRCYCILKHPVPKTGDADSGQIIIPQNQLNRKHDIYISWLNWTHCVAPKGVYIALVSTVIETSDPKKEIVPALKLLGKVEKHFLQVSPNLQPSKEGDAQNIFVSKSMDPATHFEEVVSDVLDIYQRVTGQPLEIKIPEDDEQ